MKNENFEKIAGLGLIILLILFTIVYIIWAKSNKIEKTTALESVLISSIRIDEETSRLLSNVDILIDELFVEREKNKILQKELDICKKTCVVKENK